MFPSPDDLSLGTYENVDPTSLSSLGVIGDMLTTPAQVDWVRPFATTLLIDTLTDEYSVSTTVTCLAMVPQAQMIYGETMGTF